jgi:hypothetical protein
MNTEVAKISQDGFAYADGIEGEERSSVIKGRLVKFTNDAAWLTTDDEELSGDLELVVIDIARVVQKWADGNPIETRMLAPDEKVPDVKALNEETPRKEWIDGPDGQKRGPWQFQHLVYLLNPETMDVFTFATGTVGGAICVRDIRDRTNWMRRFRGSGVYPVVTLSDVFMNTRFGGRQRPHFKAVRFVALGGNGEAKQITDGGLKMVQKPTVSEEIGDQIPH